MKLRTKVAALTFAAASVATAGIVYAYWTSEAAGTGSAASTTSEDGTIAGVTPDVSDDLYPGAVMDAYVTITNPNDYPVIVTQINAGGSRAVNGCAAKTVRTDQLGAGTAAVAQSDGTTTVIAANDDAVYKLVLRMSNTATDSCKDQDFVIGDLTTPTDDLVASIRSAASTTNNDF